MTRQEALDGLAAALGRCEQNGIHVEVGRFFGARDVEQAMVVLFGVKVKDGYLVEEEDESGCGVGEFG
jgi:hypothetical protein